MLEKNNKLIEITPIKIDYTSKVEVATKGIEAAQEAYLEAAERFEELADFSFDKALSDDQIKLVTSNSDLTRYFEQAREALVEKRRYEQDKNTYEPLLAAIKTQQSTLEQDLADLATKKTRLNKAFYTKYSRFIQEGTWISEEYIDDEKYYVDAQSTLYNSCWPQVSYSITVANLENHEEYKQYRYDIGDRTYIQDTEFFGYLEDGVTPYKKEVVISEKTEYVDNPQKDSIKIQTFKNQFQDLFKAITATVQQVQYSTGAYQKAAELAVSNEEDRLKFLQGALNSAEMAIKNAGDQTVIWDNRGITVTDSLNNARQLRLVSGAIMFRTLDENGDEVWKTGITPEGISADLITAGRLDAGLIQIMDKNHPSFRWDARGLTAYLETTDGYDTTSGVRFNSRGLFGFSNIDNAHLKEINEENATFYLSEDGMRVQPANFGGKNNTIETGDYAIIGKVDEEIYVGWDKNGLPVTKAEAETREDVTQSDKPFTKIMEVGSEIEARKSGVFTIYSDGTVTTNNIKFTGSVGWTAAASPNQTVYLSASANPNRPKDGTLYNKFPNNSKTDWHKIQSTDDKYYSTTTNGGLTWSAVYSLEINFAIYSDTTFFIFDEDEKPAFDQTANFTAQGEIPAGATVEWSVNGVPIQGYNTTTMSYTVFENQSYEKKEFVVAATINGTTKQIKILGSVQKVGSDGITCYIESSKGFLIEESETGDVTLTARIYQGTTEIDEKGSNLTYYWYKNSILQSGWTGKKIVVSSATITNSSVHFIAKEKST